MRCPDRQADRRILTDTDSRRGKCNIHFARDAFQNIRDLGSCCAIAIDISSYFESLNHERLKSLWCRLLAVDRLPPDHFAVFTNITKYRVVDRTKAYERLGHFGEKSKSKGGLPINGYKRPGSVRYQGVVTLPHIVPPVDGDNMRIYRHLGAPHTELGALFCLASPLRLFCRAGTVETSSCIT